MATCSFEILNGSSPVMSYQFPLNPENLTYQTSARTFQNQSRSALSVQRYGRGFTSIQMSGTTGFRGGTGRAADNGHGRAKSLELTNFLYTYLDKFSDDVANTYKLIFFDTLNDRTLQVELQPGGFTIGQNISSPLMYNYQINLMVVGDLSKATTSEISNTLLGNNIRAGSGAMYVDSRTMESSQLFASNIINSEFG